MENQIVPSDESVVNQIYLIRNHRVMLDMDLAVLYGVETKQLKRAVKRNIIRFPEDFMFELTEKEWESLRCQIGTSNVGHGGSRYTPMAFTEQGVAMLSSVLNSEKAILVNIHIIRVFTKMRQMILVNKDILLKVEQLEQTVGKHDDEIRKILLVLREIMNPERPGRRIGFTLSNQSET